MGDLKTPRDLRRERDSKSAELSGMTKDEIRMTNDETRDGRGSVVWRCAGGGEGVGEGAGSGVGRG